jgi:sialic acid synthase SpsE
MPNKTFSFPKISAEAGKNFIINDHPTIAQCLDEAKNLARVAKESGADAVKFQTHVFDDEQNKRAPVRYEWITLNESVTPYDEFWLPLKKYCDEIGITFMTTPMSRDAAIKVNDLVTVWKVGSADVTDLDLLTYLAETKKPVILSTGMSTLDQIVSAFNILKNQPLVLAHCVSIYPLPIGKANLWRIKHLSELFDVMVGFSDHTTWPKTPYYAIKAGAYFIEKHFTFDRGAVGPDHRISLEPKEFKQMVGHINEAVLEEQINFKPDFQEQKLLEPQQEEIAYWTNFRANETDISGNE